MLNWDIIFPTKNKTYKQVQLHPLVAVIVSREHILISHVDATM